MEEIYHDFNDKNINLTNEELELIQGGADSYGKYPNGKYDWEIEPVLTLPVHGFCPRGTYDLGYIEEAIIFAKEVLRDFK